MDDSYESQRAWLLLLHHLPPRPDYFRVRVRRQLQQLGAVSVKNAAYVLPNSARSLEEFQNLAAQIRRDGGEALVAQADFMSGISSDELMERFREQSNAAYADVIASARSLTGAPRPDAIGRLERQWESIRERDVFAASGRADAQAALNELRRHAEARVALARLPERPAGATWVTQQGVSVGSIACAWLILRFIDRSARFRFVPGVGYRPAPGDVPFALLSATEKDRTSMSLLIARFGLAGDAVLLKLAELVDDIESAEEPRHGETSGLRMLFRGVIARYGADAERVEHGRRILDQLYTHFTRVSL